MGVRKGDGRFPGLVLPVSICVCVSVHPWLSRLSIKFWVDYYTNRFVCTHTHTQCENSTSVWKLGFQIIILFCFFIALLLIFYSFSIIHVCNHGKSNFFKVSRLRAYIHFFGMYLLCALCIHINIYQTFAIIVHHKEMQPPIFLPAIYFVLKVKPLFDSRFSFSLSSFLLLL